MTKISMFLDDVRWSPGFHVNGPPVGVSWFTADTGQHLVVEAPNWANAAKWGKQAALKAYAELSLCLPEGTLGNRS